MCSLPVVNVHSRNKGVYFLRRVIPFYVKNIKHLLLVSALQLKIATLICSRLAVLAVFKVSVTGQKNEHLIISKLKKAPHLLLKFS